jgi:hypothetical protein
MTRRKIKKPPRKLTGKCCICGRSVYSDHSCYCLRCFQFSRRMDQRGIHAKSVKAIWEFVRKNGYVCYYTGMALDMENFKSPWYFSFDHRIPGDDTTVVLTCALVNEMKSDMTDDEFYYYVHQLDKNKRTGAKIRKKKLVYWERLHPPQGNGFPRSRE